MSALTRRRRLRQFLLAHAKNRTPGPHRRNQIRFMPDESCGAQAARSLVIRAVRLQQSAMISHTQAFATPSHTFPVLASIVPSVWRDIR